MLSSETKKAVDVTNFLILFYTIIAAVYSKLLFDFKALSARKANTS